MAAKTKKTQNTEAVQKVTVRGIEVEIDAGVFDDFELMEDFYEIQTSNPLRVIPLFTRIFGADQKKVVLDALRGDNGRVSGTDATTFLLEVMGGYFPKLLKLAAVVHHHPSELDADFLRFYRISNWHEMPMRRVADLTAVMIRQPESWTHRALVPDWRWEDPAMVAQALSVDYLAFLAWAKTSDGEKGVNRPDPFPRPGIEVESASGDEFVAVTSDELEEILRRNRTE